MDTKSSLVNLETIGKRAKQAARLTSRLTTDVKNKALINIANSLEENVNQVLEANSLDYEAAALNKLNESVLDRLKITYERLSSIAKDVRTISALDDPIGQTDELKLLPNGVKVGKRTVPLGVIATIYESRPNVTIDISSLCLKSGNAVILRGGSEAFNTNSTLVSLIRDSIEQAGAPRDSVQFIKSTDKALVGQLLEMKDYIDLIIPRGGSELVHRVVSEAKMPAITGGIGVCHIYVDTYADVDMAVLIANNAKVSRPYVCNALDTLLVHSNIAPKFLPKIAAKWKDSGVEIRGDKRTLTIIGRENPDAIVDAKTSDWGTEFLSLTASIKIVDSIDEALEHIYEYSSGHTEAIISEDYHNAMHFLDEVDAGVVLVNASTRFNDGGQLGLGAEVGISTSKMHARGPMGLKELTSYKWTAFGSGQIRE